MEQSQNNYYTPAVSEFIQGFEFEILEHRSYTMGMLDLGLNSFGDAYSIEYNDWVPTKVWWKHEPKEMITYKYDDCDITVSGYTVNWFSPYSDERLIELIQNGKIRAKRQ